MDDFGLFGDSEEVPGRIRMSREWAMSSGNTFSIPPIRKFVERNLTGANIIVDPFANSCRYGTLRNDLNPEYGTEYCMDALDFLSSLEDRSADVVLFDPPYSPRQASELYKAVGKELLTGKVTNFGYWSRCKDEAARVLRHGGTCLSFGWNSNGLGKKRGMTLVEVLLVAHGGGKNDTICCREVKA